MEIAKLAEETFLLLYTVVLVVVCMYGAHRYAIVYLYYRNRRRVPKPLGEFDPLPPVTVQLPMYNEQEVAARVIDRACRIDYPRDKLQIQVLDDSTDGTCEIATAAVERARAAGFDVEYIHRDDRSGYKAGALANGLKTAKGEFVSIFDADFIPDESFLKRSVHYFTDPKVCVVQTRWDHLNRAESLLTRTQAIFLDGHFAIEHVARNRSDRFMSFNGTAGTWRLAAIGDAGGWQGDTLTEDLDLSYRAQMKGWRFVFLPELTSPAELPPEMSAFKAQQFRWTKGGAQTALKMLPKVMLSKLPLKVKVEAFFHLTSFTMHFYVLLLVLMLLPAMCMRSVPIESGTAWRSLFDMTVFALATMSASVFYIASQFELFRDWRSVLKYLPVLMALGVGLCISNTKAIFEAVFGKQSEFVRTPKYGGRTGPAGRPAGRAGRRSDRSVVACLELLMGAYMVFCIVCSLVIPRAFFTTPFLLIFAFGFFYVSLLTFQSRPAGKVAAKRAEQPAEARA
jgi:cellulose synthase/poly-beta-1,6-N-acetylglucosamine synthase-like glycosyltransferase